MIGVLAVLFGLTATVLSAWHQDWTYDEPYHMQWSRRLLHEGRSGRAATPLYNSKTPITMLNVLAKDTARGFGVRGWPLSFWARLPGLWYLATVAAVFVVGRRFLGERAALLAVIATALEPNLIAHGAIATVDAAYACVTLLCLGAGLAYAVRPSMPRAALAGATLGLALSTKFTAFLLIPGLALIPAVFAWRGRFARGWRRLAADAVVTALAAAVVVDAAYLLVGIAEPLGTALWKSTLMSSLAAAAPGLRLPLPTGFLTGFDICLSHERTREWVVLALGRRYIGGVPWFFLVMWLFKTPLLIVFGQVIGTFRTAQTRRLWREPVLLALFLNVALAWIYFSFLFRTQIGYRYLLMALPLMVLVAAAGWDSVSRDGWLTAGAALLATVSVAENLPYLGNHLAFTNALVFPKRAAFHYATNSIDYGQRAHRVRAWLESAEVGPLAFEPTHIRPGFNLIGVNLLAGARRGQYRWLRENVEPERHVAHTHLLFRIDASQYERFIDEDRSLVATATGEHLCQDALEGHEVAVGEPTSFPTGEKGVDAWLVCAETTAGADLGLVAERGSPFLGLPHLRAREWDSLWPGQEAWYRLAPGRHALAATHTGSFRGRWESRGEVRLRLLPGEMLRGGYVRRLPVTSSTGPD